MSDLTAVLLWWLALTGTAIACAPIVWWTADGLGPAKNALLRPVGLILATAVVWWPASLLGIPFTRTTLMIGIAVLALATWTMWLRTRSIRSIEWRPLLLFELVWLTTLLGYLVFRSANPDIINTEKPMEIALLTSISRSADVPAPDPWFAGEPINYYYFGYQTFATIIKLTGIPTSIAFNLALATSFASIATIAAGLGHRIASAASLGRWLAVGVGILTPVLVLIAGNLETFIRLVRDPGRTISAGWWDGVGWQASRIIYDTGVHGDPNPSQTINEFPAFSFVLGDLHPHVITYPALLAVLSVGIGFILKPSTTRIGQFGVAGFLAGLLYASNSWDAPVGVVILLGAVVITSGVRSRTTWMNAAAVVAGAALAAFPFALHYTAPVGVDSGDVPDWLARVPVIGTITNTLAVVTWRPSSTAELLTVHGVWLGLFMLFAIWAIPSNRRLIDLTTSRQGWFLAGALLALAIGFAWAPAVPLLGIPAAVGLALAVLDGRSPVRVVGGLFFAGFALALIPEFLYIQDPFGDRMNTIFKLYFQAWVFLSIASACGAVIAIAGLRLHAQKLAGVGALMLVLASLPYAPLSAEDWVEMGSGHRTLDGGRYIEARNANEAAVLDWLRDHAEEGDVIVESPGCGYGNFRGIPMNRYSAFTGVPTVIGWANHESQWRRGQSPNIGAILQRRQESANLWLDGETPPTDGYSAPRFLMLGPQETEGDAGCELLQPRGPAVVEEIRGNGWQLVFEQGDARVFVRESDPIARQLN